MVNDSKNNPWYDFLLASIELDKGDDGARETKPYGWHWFWGIYGLHRKIPTFPELNIDVIEKQLPDNECVRLKPHEEEEESFDGEILPSEMQQEATNALYNFLKEFDSLERVKKIDFSKWNFPKYADLSRFIFPIDTSFEHTSFATSPDFSNTIFCDKVSFSRAVFTDNVFFNGAQFFYEAKFTGTKFRHEIFSDPCFNKAVFLGRALFTYAEFEGKALFKETVFSDDAIFQDTKFTWGANFKKAKFFKGAIFTNATFREEIKFDGATFEGHTNFINTKFKKYVPNFYKADMYSDIIWDGAKWPKPSKKTRLDVVPRNKLAYENLVSHMKELDKHDDEHFFYRHQTSCQRQLERHLIIPIYWLYEKFANYGYGLERALLWWLGHVVVGMFAIAILSLINSWLECWKDGAWETTKNALCSIPLSVANAHGFLPFYKGALSGCYTYFVDDNFFNTIWVFQTILGAIFLFLFLLTLRIRFRLK